MYSFLRPLIFKLDPEAAHGLSLMLARLSGRLAPIRSLIRAVYSAPAMPVHAMGLTFENPIGLAAGYDKDGLAWRGLACLGFGHIEVGTVTPQPQPGNPRPRLFRAPEEEALINRLGFPGKGAPFVAARLAGPRPPGLILGVNLGKNKDTPLERAVDDYVDLLRMFSSLADYLAINVSSPNTVGLRQLQARQALTVLLGTLADERRSLERGLNWKIPLLVKLSPDLEDYELEDALQVIITTGMDGVIAGNSTLSREGLRSGISEESGGMSGVPLRQRSTRMVRQICSLAEGKISLIAAGGVMSAADVKEKLGAGASLVQIYTGLVYRGPGLVREMLSELGGQGMSNTK